MNIPFISGYIMIWKCPCILHCILFLVLSLNLTNSMEIDPALASDALPTIGESRFLQSKGLGFLAGLLNGLLGRDKVAVQTPSSFLTTPSPSVACCHACTAENATCFSNCVSCQTPSTASASLDLSSIMALLPILTNEDAMNQITNILKLLENPSYKPETTTSFLKKNETLYTGPTCCLNCEQGDLKCLATCQVSGCYDSETCHAAGMNVYKNYCLSQCKSKTDLDGQIIVYPAKACEGLCAADVQQLCSANACREYGCTVNYCLNVAPMGCRNPSS